LDELTIRTKPDSGAKPKLEKDFVVLWDIIGYEKWEGDGESSQNTVLSRVRRNIPLRKK
jgi:hypothetical protein